MLFHKYFVGNNSSPTLCKTTQLSRQQVLFHKEPPYTISLFFLYRAQKKIPDNKIAPNTKISSIEKGIQHTINDNTAEIVGYKETAYHSAMLVLYLVDRINAVKSKSIRYLECFIYITLLFAHKLFYQFCGFWR